MFWLGLAALIVLQAVMMFAFYRVVLRPLPAQINDLLFKRHLNNQFTHVSLDTAELVRAQLLQLEAERLEAVVRYEAVRGKRLNTTQKAEREGLKKAVEQLNRQIEALRGQLEALYSEPVLAHLRKFEEMRFVKALNSRLDTAAKRKKRR